jgi:hypothetical protein
LVADALVGFGDRRMIKAVARVHGSALSDDAWNRSLGSVVAPATKQQRGRRRRTPGGGAARAAIKPCADLTDRLSNVVSEYSDGLRPCWAEARAGLKRASESTVEQT